MGDGEYRSKLERYVNQKCLDDKVLFIEAVPQDVMLAYTAKAFLGVIPYIGNSMNNYLCTPNKLFEFISAGVPIIASDLPELNKIISGNNIGVVVDFTASELIAQQVLSINNQRYEQFRKNIMHIQEEYSWKFEGEKLYSALYQDIRREE